MYVCMYVCLNDISYALHSVNAHALMEAFMDDVYFNVRMYVCKYVCIYICMYV